MSGYFLSEDELLLKNTVQDFADSEIAPRAAGYDESGGCFRLTTSRGCRTWGCWG